uniref:Trafficking protein particle complex subunit n=1 Tax=Corethron hystrix TaxID=216773 RepID=A0A7S1G0B8_9STRA|mmetsp:Transcript_42420/g.99611  ORF Transcript_42420/g.99611 Transcript_42420/m.99611 type:complete len:203 (+) Transcript_42420:1102-1710(+)
MSSKTSFSRQGEQLWAKMPKANTELFALTYGAIVSEIVRDSSSAADADARLDAMGFSIGVRLIDEYCAKASLVAGAGGACRTLQEAAQAVAKVGFKMFLGVSCDVAPFPPDGRSFSLILYDNPLTTFVELPEREEADGAVDLSQMCFSNVYCGVIRGALEQVNLKVKCTFVRDVLKGDDVNEILVELKEVMADGAGEEYQEE